MNATTNMPDGSTAATVPLAPLARTRRQATRQSKQYLCDRAIGPKTNSTGEPATSMRRRTERHALPHLVLKLVELADQPVVSLSKARQLLCFELTDRFFEC